jgi:hypothetical protein
LKEKIVSDKKVDTRDWKEIPSAEFYSMLGVLEKSLSRPEEKAMLKEMADRLLEYSKINTSMVPPRGDGMTDHALHILHLKNATQFYGVVSHTLNVHSLLDWNEPFEKVSAGLSAAINAKDRRSEKLLALICEIYATGGVKYRREALPEEVDAAVTTTLKARGIIPSDMR